MADINLAAGVVASPEITLTANTVQVVTFADNLASVAVVSDGMAKVRWTSDGSTPSATSGFFIPAQAAVDRKPTRRTSADVGLLTTTVKLWSAGTPTVVVTRDDL